MIDIDDLVSTVEATRSELAAIERREADQRSGLAAARPAIEHMNAVARPSLDAAVTQLKEVGIVMTIEEGWNQYANPKRAVLEILCSPGAGWPSRAMTARGHRVFLTAKNDCIAVTYRAHELREGAASIVETSPAGEVEAAVRMAVHSFLEAASAGARMQGAVLHMGSTSAR